MARQAGNDLSVGPIPTVGSYRYLDLLAI